MRGNGITGWALVACIGAGMAAQAGAEVVAPPPPAAAAARFVDEAGDVVRDRDTGLRWTRKDSGYAVDWFDARGYCARLGAGWHLPSAEALDAVAIALRDTHATCDGADCKPGGPFRLGNGWVWSGTSNGISDAVAVNLLSGEQQVAYRARKQRALCAAAS